MEYKEHDHHEHEDLHHVLLDRYEEELEDACTYARLAEEHPEEAVGFNSIGREEVTHAIFLRKELEDLGHEFSEEHEKKWHRVLKKYGFEK